MYLKRLGTIFDNKPFCNNLFFFAVAAFLLLISFQVPLFFLIFGIYLLFIYKKTTYIFAIIALCACICLSFFVQSNKNLHLQEGIYEEVYEVEEIKNKYAIIKGKRKILVYNTFNLKSGDIIYAKVEVTLFREKRYSTDFDAKTYYASKRVYNQGKLLTVEIMDHKISSYSILHTILGHYQKVLNKKSYAYLQACIFGIVDLDEQVEETYSSLYISHLFAISGMHILLLYQFLCFIIQRIFKKEGSIIAIFVLFGYIWLIGFPISAVRAYLFLFFSFFNRFGTLRYTKLDIWSLSFLLLVLVQPFTFYQMSFILSFIINFILIFKEEFIRTNSKILNSLFTSLLCIFSIFPFLIQMNSDISFVGMGIGFIFGVFFSKFLYPVLFFSLLFPFPVFEQLWMRFETILLFIHQFLPIVRISTIPLIFIILYYLIYIFLLIMLASKKFKAKYYILFICLFFIFIFYRYGNPFYRITFIDVGQGDSALIEFPYEKGTILIDSFSDNYTYLKKSGIQTIDAVILTHFDADHIGSIDKILEKFRVKKLYYSKFEDKNKIKNLQVEKIPIGQGDDIKINSLSLHIMGPTKCYSNANSNSVVFWFQIQSYKFLFTGDMTMEEENDLIEFYKENLKSDILKVGHHGSNTSSSLTFLQNVRPSISIISVGKKNKYNLPDDIIVKRLKKYSQVYMTKDCGNIKILIYKHMKIIPYRKIK